MNSWKIHLLLCLIFFSGNIGQASARACFGDDLNDRVKLLLADHLSPFLITSSDCKTFQTEDAATTILFGENEISNALIGPSQLSGESFEVRRVEVGEKIFFIARGATALASNYAAYELLENLGFSFLHPLAPNRPKTINWPSKLDFSEKPLWPVRRWHLHTQHPLELTNLLNGWGPNAADDPTGFESMLPEWDRFLEWCLANKQNQVSWYLLMAKSWQDYADSPGRQARLKRLVDRAHDFGFKAGMTAPLAFKQQHAWTMIRKNGEEEEQIRKAIDWLAATKIDFIELEMGFNEFTHPDDRKMLSWMNTAADYAKSQYQISTAVKIHASTGQEAKNFKNPETGEALNFNFLPYYASKNLGVMPHTVQHYGLFDAAPTYGNESFSDIYHYMRWEAGRREVLFYPETAYWVSFDIDVPLFLPIYAERRLSDLRLIAKAEAADELGTGENKGSVIQGQVNFSSGWEWGYWLNDVVTARAAWNPHLELSDRDALQAALRPLSRRMGEAGQELAELLADIMKFQKDTLIDGKIDGVAPSQIAKRSGQAYLQGVDAWDDIAELFKFGSTQPAKLGLVSMRNPFLNNNPDFDQEIRPLLKYMKDRLESFDVRMKALKDKIPDHERAVYDELQRGLELTALRARQVYALYSYVAADKKGSIEKVEFKLLAQDSLNKAQEIVKKQEQNYRTDFARISAWKEGPTAYPYGYLWTVHSLYYWWRDEVKSFKAPISPCVGNILDPFDVAFGFSLSKLSFLGECLNKPVKVPELVRPL